MTILIGVILFIAAIIDIKSKKVNIGLVIVLGLFCVFSVILNKNVNIWEISGGIAIGLSMIGLSLITNNQIGKGDGMVIAMLGIALGFRDCLMVMSLASVIMAFLSIVLLIVKKANKKTRLPFIPALFISFVTINLI